ncbi:MAG: xanthine dehydrogenase [Acidobacteria bacterium]|nr:MAG: xanthine dehydrogenase [Acidobacteriota bacterium]
MNLVFHEEMVRLLRAGRPVAVATVVGRQGSTPRDFGAKMIVTEEGETVFSIGGGAFEALVIEDAREAIRERRGIEKEYRFTEQGANALGMVCGGSARVLIEVVRPPDPLLVFGAGHVGREVAHLGARLGFEVTMVDDRPRYLEPARFPAGVRRVRVAHDFSGVLPEVPRGAFVAVLTRCHRTDLVALRHAVGREAGYVGLIGSRRKVATVLARARDQGTPAAALAEVRAPIGLPIAAETPEEIAVSIVAEMIAVRRGSATAALPGRAGAGRLHHARFRRTVRRIV